MKESFISTHTQLPNSTKLLIVMSDLVRYNFEILIILMILGIIIFYNLIFKSEKIKYEFDKMIFEFKYTKDARENLESLADKALQQIDDKKYDTELRNAGVKSIIKIGIAFRGKNAVVKQG